MNYGLDILSDVSSVCTKHAYCKNNGIGIGAARVQEIKTLDASCVLKV